MVVWNVTPALHTPLMSVTNAITAHHRHRRAAADCAASGARVVTAELDPVARRRRRRAHLDQHVRRLRGHAPHAGDVPQIRRPENVCRVSPRSAYLGATILFILSLGGLVQPGDRPPRELLRHRSAWRSPCSRPLARRATAISRAGIGSPASPARWSIGGADRAVRRAHGADDRRCPSWSRSCTASSASPPARSASPATSTPRRGIRPAPSTRIHERRDLHWRADRRRHLHRLGDRVRQAVRQDRRQAAAAAGPALAEPRRPAGRDLSSAAGSCTPKSTARRHAAADRHDGDRARCSACIW